MVAATSEPSYSEAPTGMSDVVMSEIEITAAATFIGELNNAVRLCVLMKDAFKTGSVDVLRHSVYAFLGTSTKIQPQSLAYVSGGAILEESECDWKRTPYAFATAKSRICFEGKRACTAMPRVLCTSAGRLDARYIKCRWKRRLEQPARPS